MAVMVVFFFFLETAQPGIESGTSRLPGQYLSRLLLPHDYQANALAGC